MQFIQVNHDFWQLVKYVKYASASNYIIHLTQVSILVIQNAKQESLQPEFGFEDMYTDMPCKPRSSLFWLKTLLHPKPCINIARNRPYMKIRLHIFYIISRVLLTCQIKEPGHQLTSDPGARCNGYIDVGLPTFKNSFCYSTVSLMWWGIVNTNEMNLSICSIRLDCKHIVICIMYPENDNMIVVIPWQGMPGVHRNM